MLKSIDFPYDERRHRVGRAVLIELLIVDGVGRFHSADSKPVHVEIVLRVHEACGSFFPLSLTRRRGEAQSHRFVAVVELVELVVAQHGREIAPRRVAHVDFPVLHATHQRGAVQHRQPLRSIHRSENTSRSPGLNMSRSVSMSPSALCMYISWNVICSFGPRRALNLREINKDRELPVRQTFHLLHHQIDVMPVTLFTLRGIG